MSELIEIKVDDPGNTVRGRGRRGQRRAGASVGEGDALLEIATDKANMDIEAPADGRRRRAERRGGRHRPRRPDLRGSSST